MSWSNMKLFSSWEDNLPHLSIYLSIYQSTHAIISHHQNDVIKCELFWLYFSAVIGEIDEDTDSTLDLGNIRAEPLNSVVHWLRPTSTSQPRLYTTLMFFLILIIGSPTSNISAEVCSIMRRLRTLLPSLRCSVSLVISALASFGWGIVMGIIGSLHQVRPGVRKQTKRLNGMAAVVIYFSIFQ